MHGPDSGPTIVRFGQSLGTTTKPTAFWPVGRAHAAAHTETVLV